MFCWKALVPEARVVWLVVEPRLLKERRVIWRKLKRLPLVEPLVFRLIERVAFFGMPERTKTICALPFTWMVWKFSGVMVWAMPFTKTVSTLFWIRVW